mgnify:CR=1 FL=1|jgi:thiamine transporter
MTGSPWTEGIEISLQNTKGMFIIISLGVLVFLLWLTHPSRIRSKTGGGFICRATEICAAVALSVMLSMIPVYRMPQGKWLSLEMLPIFYIALRSGGLSGVITGLIFGAVKFSLDPYIAYPLELILDYPLAFTFPGLVGFFRNYRIPWGIILTGLGRFAIHILSGSLFLINYIPKTENPWFYLASFYGPYILPELIISVIIMFLLGLKDSTLGYTHKTQFPG